MSALIVKIPSKDVYVDSNFPTQNFGGSTVLFNGLFLGSIKYRDLLQFDLSTLPSGYIITKAELALYILRNDFPVLSKTFNIYRIKQNFEEYTVTYNTQPQVASDPSTAFLLTNELNTFVRVDITELVREWYQGKYPNHGLLIRAANETINSLVTFYSKEASDDTYYPQLEINLEEPVQVSSKGFTSTSEIGLTTEDSYRYTTAYDVSEIGIYTFFVINTGSSNICDAVIQVSPNLVDWIDDSSINSIIPEEMKIFYPMTFSRYVRLAYKSNTVGSSTTLDYYIQTQT